MFKNNKNLAWIILALSLVGLLDASYLAIKHYQGAPVICSIIEGCDKVTASIYSTLGGIPVALLGVFYYFLILFLVIWYLWNGNKKHFSGLMRISIVGFLASLWFVYLQVFVIKAICLYCMVSALTATAIFLLFLILSFKKGV
ncbi:MAG: vitamin K epoxide reductase family protein [Candidatus Harrisonbacteria bacterium]|nr:vitamin K epoxide reductase family protein [Candidatus Harrisonbacteria bacterium]